ncbi:MAG: alpha/beta hydrolase [Bacteroidales bacterium]|nr:alpha/beta hydrolase [Bacteroidales bacterium]
MEWKTDILGNEFRQLTVNQGLDYDGPVRCTVVRYAKSPCKGRGVLYVHGFSDYFFQAHVAKMFYAHGYDFYAVDLRKYGRSILDRETMFQVKNLREYFDDIQAAIGAMKDENIHDVVLMGHSTGGLTASLYMMEMPDDSIRGLILNSPFLTWNMHPLVIKFGIPVVKALSHLWPHLKMRSDTTNRYAASVARHLGGEWDYDTNWKSDVLPAVTAQWVAAIDNAQKALRGGTIKVPVLLLHSDKSAGGRDGMDKFRKADGVLNVVTMAEAGRKLGPNVEEVTINDGLHDLVLSRKEVRDVVFDAIFHWLESIFPEG